MESNQVILVDENDVPTGVMEKLEAHQKGELHRAFSIFIFNSKGEMLLQKRALHKYHSGGLWTNACCSHPQPNESNEQAAHRRLMEEMGFDCVLEKKFHFIYKAQLNNELTEHELDHVFIGTYNKEPRINLDEVADWKYIKPEFILEDIRNNSQNYTYWFKEVLEKVIRGIK
jgi:isopentenyl-diphosphate delta-isomerase